MIPSDSHKIGPVLFHPFRRYTLRCNTGPTKTFSKHLVTIAVLIAVSAATLLTTGCGAGTLAGAGSGLGIAPQEISGKAMGGNGPIGNASVKLYVAGTGGYGLGGTTALASTTTLTNSTGYFTISPGSYTCPAGGQAYLVLKGGDPNGGSAASNTAISLIAPLGTCGSLPSYTVINEATTVATIFSAAQFFNASTETFGSNSTTQSELGLSNAFALAMQLVPQAQGFPNVTFTPSSSVTGITMTATPDAGKLQAIADILAACVNTTANTSANCTDLFNSAVAPSATSELSGSTSTYPAVTDTLIAAYYMAVNPVDAGATGGTSGTNSNCAAASNTSVPNITCLYDLIPGAGTPFSTTGFSAVPSDWTIGIAYTSSGTCTAAGGGSFILGPYKSAVDASGNFWFISGAAPPANANLSEMGPQGQALNCLGNLAGGRGMTIDTNGNIWASFNTDLAAAGVVEVLAGNSTLTTWPMTGGAPYYMAADGNGNVFYTTIGSGGGIAEIIDPGTTTTPFPQETLTSISITGVSSSSNSTSGMVVDASNHVWMSYSSTEDIVGDYPGSATTPITLTGYSVASNVVTYTNSGTNTLAAGGFVTIADSSPLNGQSLAVLASPAPTSTSFAVSFNTANATVTESGTATPALTYTPGIIAPLGTPYGFAADAGGNVYNGTTCCSGTTANRFIEKFVPGATATATTRTNSTQDVGGINGVRSVAIDGAGNLWAGMEYPGVGTVTGSVAATYGVAEMSSAFTAISPATVPATCSVTAPAQCPTGGFLHAGLGYAQDMEIDPSGNVWVVNNGTNGGTPALQAGTQIEQIIGAAVPIVTPLSVAIKTGKLATKP